MLSTRTVCSSDTAAASVASSMQLTIALLHLRAWEAPGLAREGAESLKCRPVFAFLCKFRGRNHLCQVVY